MEAEIFPQPKFIQTSSPVLLCHGYGAFVTMVKPGLLHDVAMFLRSHGIPAFAPNIVPYATIETRAEAWAKIIPQVLNQTGASQLSIIAHSMAGLDMRYALYAYPELRESVRVVISIASPHHGASLAELALKTPDFVKDNFLKLSDWLGNKWYSDMKSDTSGALRQLTRGYVTGEFEKQVGEPPVPFYSVTASCGKGTNYPITTALKGFNLWIYEKEGVNDGFVSEESAHFGTHLRTIPFSHTEQILLQVSSDVRKKVCDFWLDLITFLA